MKILAFPSALFACLLTNCLFFPATVRCAPGAAENESAYQALRVARSALGAEAMNRLVEVTGRDGVPQPYLWKIVREVGSKTPGFEEVDVAGGKIVAQHLLSRPPASASLVKLETLNLDSSGAFDAANAQSLKARVRFDTVDYALRANEAGQPVWAMELFNQDGASVGTMHLTATDGTIASIDGRLAKAAGRPGEPLTAAVNASTTSTTTAAPTTTTTSSVPAPTTISPVPVTTVSPPGATTTTVETITTVPARPLGSEPPPVHDVDVEVAPATTSSPDDGHGGFFTRAGRTLDHTQGHVVHSLDTAHDNVVHGIDTANKKVDHSLRATGATLERFFTGHTDLDHN